MVRLLVGNLPFALVMMMKCGDIKGKQSQLYNMKPDTQSIR